MKENVREDLPLLIGHRKQHLDYDRYQALADRYFRWSPPVSDDDEPAAQPAQEGGPATQQAEAGEPMTTSAGLNEGRADEVNPPSGFRICSPLSEKLRREMPNVHHGMPIQRHEEPNEYLSASVRIQLQGGGYGLRDKPGCGVAVAAKHDRQGATRTDRAAVNPARNSFCGLRMARRTRRSLQSQLNACRAKLGTTIS